MKIAEVMGIVSKETVPTAVRIPAFAGLPAEVQDQLRDLLGPMQDRGVRMELDPVMPDTVGVLLEGMLFRVSCVTNRHTGALSIEILGPNLAPWSREDFLALAPDVAPEPEAPPVRLGDLNIRRSQAEILEDILAELKTIRSLLASQ